MDKSSLDWRDFNQQAQDIWETNVAFRAGFVLDGL
jgi:hypothetical protein